MIYLLDTNIVLHLLREDDHSRLIEKHFAPLSKGNTPLISVVTQAELMAFSRIRKWGRRKLDTLQSMLGELIIIDINQKDILDCYAEIDAFSQGRLEGRLSDFSARNMGKNDLWIAATASVLDATLLTTDHDFDHLNTVFLKRERLSLAEMGL